MNISYDGVTVRFKTEPKELFEAEKSGTKPNTVRILDIDEYHQLRKRNPKKIVIQHQQEIFLRTITNIHATKGVFEKVIVVISWTNEMHDHHLYTIIGLDQKAHSMSLVEQEPPPHQHTMPKDLCSEDRKGFVAICISRQMFNILQNRFSGRTMDSVVQELYETYHYKLAEERGPMHD